MKVTSLSSPKIVTVSEASSFLGVSRRRVLQFLKEGRFGSRFGRGYIITEPELLEFSKQDRPVGNPESRR